MSLPLLAWSHSAVETFETCPHRYYVTKVTKEVKDEFKGPAADWGLAVHKAMERRIRMGSTLPSNMSQYEKLAVMLEGIPGHKFTEQQLALTEDKRKTDWFAPDVWVRIVIDLLIISPDGTKACVFDYKTGKPKSDDRQLALCAAGVFRLWPDVQEVLAGYLWMGDRKLDKLRFQREHEDKLWAMYRPSVQRMEHATIHGSWPKKRSGLCRGYCPVKSCEFWEPKRKK